MMIKDENGCELIGYIEIGGMAMQRGELARALPDFKRFERCLGFAQKQLPIFSAD